jgi:transposase
MAKFNTIGVDLAKNVIQVSVVSPSGKELLNKELTRAKFAEFLAKQKSALVAFESCATAHYWSRSAQEQGHQTKIIPAKAVAPFRQGHKTDKNDALAVAEAAKRPNIKEAPLKSVEQQGLQSIQRSRELLIQNRTAISNHIRGLLMEFGVVIPKGFAHLNQHVPRVLEDAENGVPDMFRATLHRMFERYLLLKEDIDFLNEQIKQLVKQYDPCRRLMDLEGVGPIGAILVFATLGTGQAFKNGREFSAYIGLTPKQYSSGGKTNLIGISKHVANRRLRSVLIQGARAYVHKLKDPQTPKQKWLWALIQRAGYGKAAVALANKNVRTAWALLTSGAVYNRAQNHEALAA